MKKKIDQKGFAMIEVLIIMMVFAILASSLYGYSGIKHRKVLAKVCEDEAHYAAVSAVRLMEREILSTNAEEGNAAYVLSYGDGMRKKRTYIAFESETGEKEVQLPVTIWSERDGDTLVLEAEATQEKQTSLVKLHLIQKQITETESCWVPVSYEF